MKLLVETTEDFNVIYEEADNGPKKMFIEGVFMQAERVNRNGRVYPKAIMEREVNRYVKEAVSQNTAAGELGHPQGPQMNLDRISHRITSLKMEGNNVVGKALLLNTEAGKTAKALIEGGLRIGVSSRALGSVKESTYPQGGGNVKVVQPDFKLFAVDIVADPSAPEAYVDPLHENVEWIYEDGVWKPKQLQESTQVRRGPTSRKTRDDYYRLFQGL